MVDQFARAGSEGTGTRGINGRIGVSALNLSNHVNEQQNPQEVYLLIL